MTEEYINFSPLIYGKSYRHIDLYPATAGGWRTSVLINSPCPDDKANTAEQKHHFSRQQEGKSMPWVTANRILHSSRAAFPSRKEGGRQYC